MAEAAATEKANNTITVRVKDQTGEETFFKVKKTTKMSKVFSAYAQRKGVSSQSMRFLLDGERIGVDETPKSLELEDQDQIDCVLEQHGGH
jgi:small ubiquitin-related modifier